MKRIAKILACLTIGLVIACDDTQDPGPAELQVQSTAEDLVGLLPSSTLAAAEFLNIDSRWSELRALPPLARLQDHVLSGLGLDADDVPAIAGSHAILALLEDESRRIVPIALLDPASPTDARQRLAESDDLVTVAARGAVWVGPAAHTRLVERTAAGDGTSLRKSIDFGLLARHLPAGGLVRVVLNPRALSAWLRRWAEYEGRSLARPLAQLFAADFEMVELAGFRRDIVDGQLMTDGWVGFASDVIPEAVTRALATERGPALLPAQLPGDAMLAKSFRTEPEAGLAWLRSVAERDPQGPLRNLDFWIAEFEARSGRDIETDIVGALGDRGLLLLLEGEAGAPELVAILDTHDSERLVAALIDLRGWLAEQIRGRSLGLAQPRPRDAAGARGVVHGLDVWSPVGTLSGPVFQIVDDHLVVATSGRSLNVGVELARAASTWTTPVWALAEGPPDEIAVVQLGALAGLLFEGSTHPFDGTVWSQPLAEFLASTEEGRLRVFYEDGGFRINGGLRITAAEPGGLP